MLRAAPVTKKAKGAPQKGAGQQQSLGQAFSKHKPASSPSTLGAPTKTRPPFSPSDKSLRSEASSKEEEVWVPKHIHRVSRRTGDALT